MHTNLLLTKGNNSKRIGPQPLLSLILVHLIDINVSAEIDEYLSLRFKILGKKNKVWQTDTQLDTRTEGQTVYPICIPHQKQSLQAGWRGVGFGVGLQRVEKILKKSDLVT